MNYNDFKMSEFQPPTMQESYQPHMVQFGQKKITFKAFLTLIAGLILALAVSVTLPYGVLMGLYILLVFSIMAYNVNCVQTGHCYFWAWILTVLYLIYASFAVFFLITKGPAIAEKLLPKSPKK